MRGDRNIRLTKIFQTIYRTRSWLFPGIVALGFWAPVDRMGGQHPSSTWLVLAGMLARAHWLRIEDASIAVAVVATLLALAAAAISTWAAAFLRAEVVRGAAFQGQQIVADGPYRYLRNPLYLGVELHVLALAILMPPTGAAFAAVAMAALLAVLIHAEEEHLTAAQGATYLAYKRQVPRILPALFAGVETSGARGEWGSALLAEIYFWGVALTYAALAWRYNAMLLTQGVLISFGVRLVVRALAGKRVTAG